MIRIHRHALTFAIAAVISSGVAQYWKPKTKLVDSIGKIQLETAFPKEFDDWHTDDSIPVQLVSPDQAAVLNKIYNQTLSRTYINTQGQRIMLSVAYGGDQSDGTRAHRPEVCYPAQGFSITSQHTSKIPLGTTGIPLKRLVAKQGNRSEPISYWVTVGNEIVLSGTQQKVAQLGYGTRGIIPDGMLVRVSSINDDTESAWLTQTRFISALNKSIAPALKQRIFGTAH